VTLTPDTFPAPPDELARARQPTPRPPDVSSIDILERAQRYVASVPPAIAGERGDLQTFKLACALVAGSGLLKKWPYRSSAIGTGVAVLLGASEIRRKLIAAIRYGRAVVGGLSAPVVRESIRWGEAETLRLRRFSRTSSTNHPPGNLA
jgi:hypothetical protein